MTDTPVNCCVEVVYASSGTQKLIRMKYQDMTAEQAIERSGIMDVYPEIDLAVNKIGIFGRHVRLSQRLKPGDRVEIYRALLVDPKQARRLRAESAKSRS